MKLAIFFIACCSASLTHAQNFAWVKQFAGPLNTNGTDIVQDAAGNIYTTGYLNGTSDFDPGPGVFNMTQPSGGGAYVSKLDANGNFIWAKMFPGLNTLSYSIALDGAGNVYTAGVFQYTTDFDPGPGVYNLTSPWTGGAHAFVSKLDNNGNFVWAKQMGGTGNQYAGTSDLKIDGSGNVITTGYFKGTTDFDPGPGVYDLTPAAFDDHYILKLNSNGDFLWAKPFYGDFVSDGESLTVDNSGNIYSTGFFQGTVDFDPGTGVYNLTSPGFNFPDIFISKLDAAGNFVFAKQFTGGTQNMGKSICLDASGNILVTGNFDGTVDFDPGPSVFNLVSFGWVDIFVLKTDPNGNFIWARHMGGVGADVGRQIIVDADANILVTGTFDVTADFDDGPPVVNLVSAGLADGFIMKMNSSGALIWPKSIGGPDFDIIYAMTADPVGNLFATGGFRQTADFDPDPSVFNLTSQGEMDGFVLKLGDCINVTTSTLNITACNSYTLNSQTYTSSGIYTQTLLNVAGCDSIITLNLTLGGSTTNISATECDSYAWEGQTFTTTGIYTATFIGADGCDSIRTIDLTINHSVSTNINIELCEGQSYQGYTTGGIYIDNFLAANGCDSIRTLNLTVKSRAFSSISSTICEGASFEGHSTTGIYVETFVGVNGCDSIRTLDLLVNPRKYTQLNVTICEGQNHFAGGQAQTTSGIYKDTLVSSLGCDSVITTTLIVNQKPKPDLGVDKELCQGKTISLDPGSFNSYLWQDMSNASSFTATGVGTYWVTVTNSFNCTATDTLKILNINPEPKDFLKATDSICLYDELVIHSLNDFPLYTWSTGSNGKNSIIQSPGNYWLRVTDAKGCVGSDTIIIYPKQCLMGIYFPTAFTPNNDGKNDFFKAIVRADIISFNLQVYDRAGQIVFQTNDPSKGWNGNYGGIPYTSAVFVWKCTYHLLGDKPRLQKGTLTLIR